MKKGIILIVALFYAFIAVNPTFAQFGTLKQKTKNLLNQSDNSTKTTKKNKSKSNGTKSSATNIYDQKVDNLEKALNNWIPWAEKNHNGENVYQQLYDATVKFDNLHQEISADIQNEKFTRKQYDRYKKIYDRYIDYVNQGY